MKKLPLEVKVVFVESRRVWKTVGISPKLENASLHVLKDELGKYGYLLNETDGYSHAVFELGDTE